MFGHDLTNKCNVNPKSFIIFVKKYIPSAYDHSVSTIRIIHEAFKVPLLEISMMLKCALHVKYKKIEIFWVVEICLHELSVVWYK